MAAVNGKLIYFLKLLMQWGYFVTSLL